MPKDGTDRTSRFLEMLRNDSQQGVGRGLHRMARLVRRGTGLASTLLARSKQGTESSLSERDLAQLESLPYTLWPVLAGGRPSPPAAP
jgi:hypothetical protein